MLLHVATPEISACYNSETASLGAMESVSYQNSTGELLITINFEDQIDKILGVINNVNNSSRR